MKNEIWRPVVGYEQLYEVSNLGRVKSLRCDKVLKSNQFEHYPRVFLYKNGKKKTRKVHSLVLEAFDRPKSPGLEARHFPDRNRANNYSVNLSWGTHQQNELDKGKY